VSSKVVCGAVKPKKVVCGATQQSFVALAMPRCCMFDLCLCGQMGAGRV
jgi:hypothetical protein